MTETDQRLTKIEAMLSDLLDTLTDVKESQERIEEKLDEMGYAVGGGYQVEFES